MWRGFLWVYLVLGIFLYAIGFGIEKNRELLIRLLKDGPRGWAIAAVAVLGGVLLWPIVLAANILAVWTRNFKRWS
jgi:hypothetical protein